MGFQVQILFVVILTLLHMFIDQGGCLGLDVRSPNYSQSIGSRLGDYTVIRVRGATNQVEVYASIYSSESESSE